jgi:predicted HNH restriction endonuclease
MPTKNPEKLRATQHRYKEKNREAINARKRAYYEANKEKHRAYRLKYQKENREKLYAYNAAWQRKRNSDLRNEMITAYGSRCACCGEAEIMFLDLDHVQNNGNHHRREFGNQVQILLWLRENGWPKEDFQLLCCNCNQGKARNGGVCPHKQPKA